MTVSVSRRTALTAAATGLLLAGCQPGEAEGEVSATEDMMREHGVLRRILIVYREAAGVLRAGGARSLDIAALGEAAGLFRTFGEDYHERKLEEQYVFPAVRRAGGAAGALVDTLLAQHARGREVTAYLQARCAAGFGESEAEPLAAALEGFARMYEAHTAREDTIVFQTWKKSLSGSELHEMGEQFEKIEHDQFKGDGFDQAVDAVARIEQRLGLADLGRFTAPPAPATATA